MPKGVYRYSQAKSSSARTGTDTEYERHNGSAVDSDYESEGETHYSPKTLLGKGGSARARLFESVDGKVVVVLDPVSPQKVDEEEMHRKYRFFAKQYPDKKRDLFEKFEDLGIKNKRLSSYKMIVPSLPGVTYRDYVKLFGPVKDIEKQIHFFLSIIAEFKKLHARELIYLDFKNDNILYDASTGRSFLIDGGISTICSHPLSYIFSVREKSTLEAYLKLYKHIAPECFTLESSPAAIAHPAKDIYSIGYFLRWSLFEYDLDADILLLTRLCRRLNAETRPTLDELSELLNVLLCKRKYLGYVHFKQSIADDKTDPLYSLIHWIAQYFLLDHKIRSYDRSNDEEQDSYLLSALPESEQNLFLEIAGHVLFLFVQTNRTAELGLPMSYRVSMNAETLTIRYKTHEQVECFEDGTEKRVDIFAKKSWKINRMACNEAFSALASMSPKLAAYTYGFNTPINSACELWRVLTKARNSRYDLSSVVALPSRFDSSPRDLAANLGSMGVFSESDYSSQDDDSFIEEIIVALDESSCVIS